MEEPQKEVVVEERLVRYLRAEVEEGPRAPSSERKRMVVVT